MLKKLFIFLVVFSITTLIAFADRVPTSSKSIRHYGIGVYKIDNEFYIFSKPDANSKKLRHFVLPQTTGNTAIVQNNRNAINPYIISIPSKKEYFATVCEYPDNNWVQIYYNQNGKEIGWAKLANKANFMTWKEFFYKYGKKDGLVLMKDVPSAQFKLFAQDSASAQVVDTFTYPEYIAMRMIRGNWMLVTVVDTGTIYKTGWFKWRSDDGKLRVFPKMK